MSVIIPRNSVIPCEFSHTYQTASDNQTKVKIKVFEGERPMTEGNNLLGSFNVSPIPPMPRGKAKILVTFKLEARYGGWVGANGHPVTVGACPRHVTCFVSSRPQHSQLDGVPPSLRIPHIPLRFLVHPPP